MFHHNVCKYLCKCVDLQAETSESSLMQPFIIHTNLSPQLVCCFFHVCFVTCLNDIICVVPLVSSILSLYSFWFNKKKKLKVSHRVVKLVPFTTLMH